jgi:hypothetical protein
LDLTETNPTAVGLPYPDNLVRALAVPDGVRYRPDPWGLTEARDAIARHANPAGPVDPAALVLSASTSEAYAFLFKLLCDPGDAVLVPQPSYPLFDLLTRLEGVEPRAYRLAFDGRWSIDRDSLARACTGRARAILVVSPNNPTGSYLRSDDREWLVSLADSRQLALVSDEVFADYPLARLPDAASLAGERRALTFALGGLSKSAGLPQMKLAWIRVSGPEGLVRDALQRLEIISDSYLSVSTPVQLATPALLEAGAGIREVIHARVRRNLAVLTGGVARHPALSLLPPEGGWSAVIRIPATAPEETIVIEALDRLDVLVHPGFFFDFAHEAFLVVSLLPEPEVFDEAIGRLLPFVEERS